MSLVRLMTLDPGHFHAALVQKEMYDGVAPGVHVYAPLGPDLLAHLGRIAGFNARRAAPTSWELEVHAGPDAAARLLRERPGNVVVLSGRNRHKIDYLLAAVEGGLNVLADKPWIIAAADLPKLEAALDAAEKNGLVAYDIMTERYEITSILQRELVQDLEVFGERIAGTEDDPGVFMESVHYLVKLVAGEPLRRPPWFFDIHQQGEGLTDVGTHLVDLVSWIAFPERLLDYRQDVHIVGAQRWPSILAKSDFQRVTGEAEFPAYLAEHVDGDELHYYCNTAVSYTLCGLHAKLNVLWNVKAPDGAGDTHFARFRGSRSAIEVRQGKEQDYRPELYVLPRNKTEREEILIALSRKVERLQERFPGVAMEHRDRELRVAIPDRYRVGHEAHFAEVTRQFLHFLKDPSSVPAWEKAFMLVKYFITTQGVETSRQP